MLPYPEELIELAHDMHGEAEEKVNRAEPRPVETGARGFSYNLLE